MSELKKYDYLTEQDEYMSIPFSVCSEYIEQFNGDELKSSMISLVDFPNCWKICQKSYHSDLYLYEGMKSDYNMEIDGSEINPEESLRRFVEVTLEEMFWDKFNKELDNDGIDNLVLTNFTDLVEDVKFDFENYIGISAPFPLIFPNKFKEGAFNKIIEQVDNEGIENPDRKKYFKKLKEQIDLL
jgi:hypothetical protein